MYEANPLSLSIMDVVSKFSSFSKSISFSLISSSVVPTK